MLKLLMCCKTCSCLQKKWLFGFFWFLGKYWLGQHPAQDLLPVTKAFEAPWGPRMGSTVLQIARLADSPGLGADGANTFPETQKTQTIQKTMFGNLWFYSTLAIMSSFFRFFWFRKRKKPMPKPWFYSILAVLGKCVPSAMLATTYHHKH